MSEARILPMEPADLLAIERHPAQTFQLGLFAAVTLEGAEELAEQGECWTCFVGDRAVACVGIGETFPGVQGVAWGVLGVGVGAAHLTVTRWARERVRQSPLLRLEAIARSADAEAIVAAHPGIDQASLLAAVLATPTPETIWAKLCGFRAAHVLRKFGAASETHVLFERIREDG